MRQQGELATLQHTDFALTKPLMEELCSGAMNVIDIETFHNTGFSETIPVSFHAEIEPLSMLNSRCFVSTRGRFPSTLR